jgi:hypothetical protein
MVEPAFGVGDPTLDNLIVQPGISWQSMPDSIVLPIVHRIDKFDSNAVNGEQVEVAARLWKSSDPTVGIAGVTLVRWPSNIRNLNQMQTSGTNNECVDATGNNPLSTSKLPNIPNSMVVTCAGTVPTTGNTIKGTVISILKGDIMAVVESFGIQPLTANRLTPIATAQYYALPAAGSSVTVGDNIIFALVGFTLLFVVVAIPVGLIFFLVRRKRKKVQPVMSYPLGGYGYQPGGYGPAAYEAYAANLSASRATVPTVATPDETTVKKPGWYSKGSDSWTQFYWDGTRWTGHVVHWNGTAWE